MRSNFSLSSVRWRLNFSQVGNQIAAIAIPLLVLQFTHSAIATGIAGAGNIIPVILAAFVGGRLIDRFGAWQVSIVADIFSSLSVLLLPCSSIEFKLVSPMVIFLLVFVGALFDPAAISARHTLIPKFARLAGIPLSKVNGYGGSLENGADLLGSAIGAGLISWMGSVNAGHLFSWIRHGSNAWSFILYKVDKTVFSFSRVLRRFASHCNRDSTLCDC